MAGRLDTELVIRAGVEGINDIQNLLEQIQNMDGDVDELRQASAQLAQQWQTLGTDEQTQQLTALAEQTERLRQLTADRMQIGLTGDEQVRQQIQDITQAFQRLSNSGTLSQQELQRATQLYEQRLQQLQAELGETEHAQQQLNHSTGGLTQVLGGLQGVLATLGVGLGVAELLAMAEQFKNIEAQIRLATGEGANFINAMQGVKDVANQTFTSMQDTGQLFSRIAQVSKDISLSQQDALNLTATIQQAIQISGGSLESNQAALTQLIQGLQSGVLRGEEFNSIMEQSPRLAQAMADGLGVTTGELRNLAQEGKLTAEVVLQAIQSQSQAINAEFQSMPTTVSNAITQVQNNLLRLVGDIDKELQSSSGLANFIQSIAEGLDNIDPATIEAVKLAFSTLGEIAHSLGGMLGDVVDTLGELWNVFDGTSNAEQKVSALTKTIQTLTYPIAWLSDGLKAVQIAGESMAGSLLLAVGKLYEGFLLITGQSTQAAENMINQGGKLLDQSIQHLQNFESASQQLHTNLNKTHQQRLDETAEKAKQAYEKMAQDGTASAGQLQEAYIQMMQAVIAAKGGVIDANLQLELAEKGLQASISDTGKVMIQVAEHSKVASESNAQQSKKLQDAFAALNLDVEEFATGLNSKAKNALDAFSEIVRQASLNTEAFAQSSQNSKDSTEQLARAYTAAQAQIGKNQQAQDALNQSLLDAVNGNQQLAERIRQTAQAQQLAKNASDAQKQALDRLGLSMQAVNQGMSKAGFEMAQHFRIGIEAIQQQATSAQSLKTALQQALDVSLQSAQTQADFKAIQQALIDVGVNAQISHQQMQLLNAGMQGGADAVKTLQQQIEQHNLSISENSEQLNQNRLASLANAEAKKQLSDTNQQLSQSSEHAMQAEKSFSDGMPAFVAAAHAKLNAMQQLGEQIAGSTTLVQHYGQIVRQSAVVDMASWIRASHNAMREIEKQAESFQNAKQSALDMTQALGKASVSSDDLAKAQAALQHATSQSIAGVVKMDSQTLDNLKNAIDSARQKMQGLANDAKQTADSLEANLARLQGNENKALQIEQSKKLAELEQRLKTAQQRGNQAEIAELQRALNLQRQINSEEQKQAQQRQAQSSQAQRPNSHHNNGKNGINTTPAMQGYPSHNVSADDIVGALDARFAEGQAQGRQQLAQELYNAAKRRAY